MTFWKQQPVDLTDRVSQIMDTKELLAKVNKEIDSSTYKLDYKVIFGEKIDALYRQTVLTFINNNYLISEKGNALYSDELLSYYLENALFIHFYPKGKPDVIAGVIIGKNTDLHIDGKVYNTVEVDFLCLNNKLRSIGLAPYMIGVLTRESIINYSERNICGAYYTIAKEIPSPTYGKKQMFHRPVNISNLVKAGFFNVPVKQNEKIFNSFKGLLPVKYSNGIANQELVKELESSYEQYCKKTYSIFSYKSQGDISRMLENKAFHNFEFRDGSGNLTDFINFYNIDTYNNTTNNTFKDGRIYFIYLSSNEPAHVCKIMETIAAYSCKYNITDVLTISDILQIKEYHQPLRFIPGGGFLNYYIFNIHMRSIENHRNGLTTI